MMADTDNTEKHPDIESRLRALELCIQRLGKQLRKVRYQLTKADERNEELAGIVVALGKRVVELGGSEESICLTEDKKKARRVS